MSLFKIRKNYSRDELQLKDLKANPYEQLTAWLNEAIKANLHEPNAMVLATRNAEGDIFQRSVLLKEVEQAGLVFFTNYESRKAKHIQDFPSVSVQFVWYGLERQLSIQGEATKISVEDSESYFASRPRESQLGAWTSQQSEVLSDKTVLWNKYSLLEDEYSGKTIPKPPFWGGYRIGATSFEFWQGGPARLHDRFLYSLEQGEWKISRLSP